MGAAPPLSVVMPVHNAMPFLDEAVASILAQTFSDFEFVILDDGSTDGSTARLRHWAERDRRIRLIVSPERLGPVGSSNRVVAEAAAPLVARMDADDVAHPDRLRRQMDILEARPDAVLVGSLAETIDAEGRHVRGPDWPRLLRASRFAPFSHPTILFRRDAFARVGGYRPAAALWEDVDLYLRLAAAGPMLVLAEPLLRIRHWQANTRISGERHRLDAAMDAMYRALTKAPAAPAGARRLPAAMIAAASVPLWAGRRPRLFRRMLREAELAPTPGSAAALAWAAWADLSPRSLRLALSGWLALRAPLARRRLGAARLFEWRPGEPPRPV